MTITDDLQTCLSRANGSLRRKMQESITLLQKAEHIALKYDADNGFFLAFSGGKDSQALIHIAQLAGVKFKAHFSPTTVDPPEVIRFIRRNYPEVEIIPPKESIYAAAVRHGILPTMRVRWCCADFKEKYGVGKVVCSGVRKAESFKRSKRNEIEVIGHKFGGNIDEFEEYSRKRIAKKLKHLNQDQFADVRETEIRCISGKDKIMLNPIIEWSDSDVWIFLNDVVRVPHCELYDQGITRIGCIGCPMATPKVKRAAFKRWPYVREKWIQTIQTIQTQCVQGNKLGDKISPYVGGDSRSIAEAYFDWWLSNQSFDKWFAQKYQQLSFDFSEKPKQLNTNE